jgi:hypothetical protein
MPLFYFQVRDGAEVRDQDGTELASVSRARIEAVRLAGNLIAEQGQEFWDERAWSMEVEDESGGVLFRLDFTASDGPRLH